VRAVCYVCRDLLPLSISHIPVSVSFAFFDNGNFMLVDPTQREQLVADGMVIVAMNKHREVCMIETLGRVLLAIEQVGVSFTVLGTHPYICSFTYVPSCRDSVMCQS